jgi:GNAT superfamily N-acetyltransferase
VHDSFAIRPAQPGDEAAIFSLVQALAAYEQLAHCVTGNAQTLGRDLFGPRPAAEALVVESEQQLVGFALFFASYSTFRTEPDLHLEDIFVQPAYRARGIGTALLRAVATVAAERHSGQLEWSVLDWNASAIGFYERLGASVLPDWRTCRLTGSNLTALARRA